MSETNATIPTSEEYQFGFNDGDISLIKFDKGLSEQVVKDISQVKEEDKWMEDFRVKSYHEFVKQSMPSWGGDLSEIDFNNIVYYLRASERAETRWEDVPEDIKNTFEKLGIPEAEAKSLSGVATQYDSEMVYHNMNKELEDKGVIFLDTDTAAKTHPELFKKYFGKLVPATDNKFAALNSAVWSGGTFIYVPPGVKVDQPLQSYFRINAENMGQFERTLIIVDEGADVHYVEGCTAPVYATDALHAAVVEIFVEKGARCRYTTIQNWSNNVYNLVTKRAICEEGASMEWIDGNIGSKLTMKYPAIILKGDYSRGMTISIAVAGNGQHQDAGSKMIHLGKHTSSTIVSKSMSRNGGNVTYRGIVDHGKNAIGAKSNIECDTIIIDGISKSDTIPLNYIKNSEGTLEHEAKVSKVSEEQLFYLMSRGLSEEKATEMIVLGFMEPFARELPMEYAVELNQLLKHEMEGSIG